MNRERTLNLISKVGMEARLQRISTEKGSTYHKVLEKRKKIPQGNTCGKVNSWRRRNRLAQILSSRHPDHKQVNHTNLKPN